MINALKAHFDLLCHRPLHALRRVLNARPSLLRSRLLDRHDLHLAITKDSDLPSCPELSAILGRALLRTGNSKDGITLLQSIPDTAPIPVLRRVVCDLSAFHKESALAKAGFLPSSDPVRLAICSENPADALDPELALLKANAALATDADALDPELALLKANAALATDQISWTQALETVWKSASLVVPQTTTWPPHPTSISATSLPCIESGPPVTVIVTIFNLQDRIGPALTSICAQTWKNLEILVVDDCSIDNSVDIVGACAEQDPRIRLLSTKKNVGPYCARNLALQEAKGELVTFHDGDDWAHPQRIERQVKALFADKRRIATQSRWIRMDNQGRFCTRFLWPLIRWNPSSILFHRQTVVNRAGYFDTVRHGGDCEFAARLSLIFGPKSLYTLRLPLAIGAHRSDSLTNAPETGWGTASGLMARAKYWDTWRRRHLAALDHPDRLREFPLSPL